MATSKGRKTTTALTQDEINQIHANHGLTPAEQAGDLTTLVQPLAKPVLSASSQAPAFADFNPEIFLLDPGQVRNPPFDQRLWAPFRNGALGSEISSSRAPFRRGYITMRSPETTPLGGFMLQRGCNFLFNPPSITTSAQFVLGAPGAQSGDQTDQMTVNASGSSTTFQLVFDRTYEMAYGGAGDASTRGCLVDIGALENITRSNNGRFLTATMVDIIFARGDQDGFGEGFVWKESGWIVGMDTTFTDFAQNMIPRRCTVNLTFQRRVVPTTSGTTSTVYPSGVVVGADGTARQSGSAFR